MDDTLIDTVTNSVIASVGIKKIFETKFDKKIGQQIQDKFNEFYNLMYQGYINQKNSDWDKLNQQVANVQPDIINKYGTYKKWSREIFIKLAADELGIKISPQLISEAANAYWITLAQISEPFPVAVTLINQIKKHHRPIYLLTSSDARLKMKNDGQFSYIPEYSEKLKRNRIVMLKNKGIDFNGLSIGDSEDKPHLDFFQKAIKIAELNLGQQIDLKNAIMVGDSFAGDLQTPKEQMGFGLVVLFQKGLDSTKIIDEHQLNTGNLTEVTNYLV